MFHNACSSIIQSTEEFIQVLFKQENLTAIKIFEENILFRAERVRLHLLHIMIDYIDNSLQELILVD